MIKFLYWQFFEDFNLWNTLFDIIKPNFYRSSITYVYSKNIMLILTPKKEKIHKETDTTMKNWEAEDRETKFENRIENNFWRNSEIKPCLLPFSTPPHVSWSSRRFTMKGQDLPIFLSSNTYIHRFSFYFLVF